MVFRVLVGDAEWGRKRPNRVSLMFGLVSDRQSTGANPFMKLGSIAWQPRCIFSEFMILDRNMIPRHVSGGNPGPDALAQIL